jgi:hypothetical protein
MKMVLIGGARMPILGYRTHLEALRYSFAGHLDGPDRERAMKEWR